MYNINRAGMPHHGNGSCGGATALGKRGPYGPQGSRGYAAPDGPPSLRASRFLPSKTQSL